MELSLHLEMQQEDPPIRSHRYTAESLRRECGPSMRWVRCVDCSEWVLESYTPDAEKQAFLISHGWVPMAANWYLPEDLSHGFFSLDEAYEMALEMSK